MNPFIIQHNPSFAIIDYRANSDIINTLKRYNLKIIKTIPCSDLQEQVSGHPDMVMHPINDSTIVIAPNVFDYYNKIFKNTRIKIIKGGKALCRNYPNDIAYNVARIGNYAIHNTDYTDKILLNNLTKNNIELIKVKQGYSKCSVASISNTCAITSDLAIQKKLNSLGFNCLYYDPKDIILNGYSNGFVGGSIGNINKNTVLLSGYIEDIAQKNKLYNFIDEAKMNIEIASNYPLTDYGTIIVI